MNTNILIKVKGFDMIRGSVTYLTTFPLVALLAHNVLFFEHPWCFFYFTAFVSAWNSLLSDIHNAHSSTFFRSLLKHVTLLFI